MKIAESLTAVTHTHTHMYFYRKGKNKLTLKEKRETNIELLRIVAMFMVIALHSVASTLTLVNSQLNAQNLIGIRFIDSLSQVAVSTFFIISGYFMINRKINIKKVFCLYGKVFFYSIVISTIFALLGGKVNWYVTLLPILSGEYWFITAYITLYLFTPVLNIMLNKLNKKQFKYLLVFSIILLGVVRMIFNPDNLFSAKILAVFMIYSIGAYIRKYVNIKSKQSYSIKYIFLTIIFTYIYLILISVNSTIDNENLLNTFISNYREFYNIIVIAMTIIIFMQFKTIKIKSRTLSHIILFISPSIFSIYLIHYNYYIRNIIWFVFKTANYADSWLLLPYMFLSMIIVFTVCLIIDLIRRGVYYLIKKIPIVTNSIDSINKLIDKLNLKINGIFK